MSLNIAEEKAEVITITGQKRPERMVSAVAVPGSSMAPMLFIYTPRDQKRVISLYEVFSGMLDDDRGLPN